MIVQRLFNQYFDAEGSQYKSCFYPNKSVFSSQYKYFIQFLIPWTVLIRPFAKIRYLDTIYYFATTNDLDTIHYLDTIRYFHNSHYLDTINDSILQTFSISQNFSILQTFSISQNFSISYTFSISQTLDTEDFFDPKTFLIPQIRHNRLFLYHRF